MADVPTETGFNQNYFRDYDPQVARYVESDPIGLQAGVNTYAYVRNNPIGASDPLGLFTSDQHLDMTLQVMQEDSAVLPCLSEALFGVVELDFLPGSQTIPYAYLHSMAQPGQDAAAAAKQANDFVNQQIGLCNCKALGYALHTVQDSAAWGHQYQTYYGHVGLLHIYNDWDPSADRRTEAMMKSRNVIAEYKARCKSCSK
jgi:RHS repeat-associated protein